MNIRTFWLIVIKAAGFWLLVQSFPLMIQGIEQSFLTFDTTAEKFENVLLIVGLTLLAYGSVAWIFLFRSSWLIRLLKLERGFTEDRLLENTKYTELFRLAVIMAGALLMLNSVPEFCSSVFMFIRQDMLFNEYWDSGMIIYYFLRSLAGYLIMTNSHFIIRWLPLKDE